MGIRFSRPAPEKNAEERTGKPVKIKKFRTFGSFRRPRNHPPADLENAAAKSRTLPTRTLHNAHDEQAVTPQLPRRASLERVERPVSVQHINPEVECAKLEEKKMEYTEKRKPNSEINTEDLEKSNAKNELQVVHAEAKLVSPNATEQTSEWEVLTKQHVEAQQVEAGVVSKEGAPDISMQSSQGVSECETNRGHSYESIRNEELESLERLENVLVNTQTYEAQNADYEVKDWQNILPTEVFETKLETHGNENRPQDTVDESIAYPVDEYIESQKEEWTKLSPEQDSPKEMEITEDQKATSQLCDELHSSESSELVNISQNVHQADEEQKPVYSDEAVELINEQPLETQPQLATEFSTEDQIMLSTEVAPQEKDHTDEQEIHTSEISEVKETPEEPIHSSVGKPDFQYTEYAADNDEAHQIETATDNGDVQCVPSNEGLDFEQHEQDIEQAENRLEETIPSTDEQPKSDLSQEVADVERQCEDVTNEAEVEHAATETETTVEEHRNESEGHTEVEDVQPETAQPTECTPEFEQSEETADLETPQDCMADAGEVEHTAPEAETTVEEHRNEGEGHAEVEDVQPETAQPTECTPDFEQSEETADLETPRDCMADAGEVEHTAPEAETTVEEHRNESEGHAEVEDVQPEITQPTEEEQPNPENSEASPDILDAQHSESDPICETGDGQEADQTQAESEQSNNSDDPMQQEIPAESTEHAEIDADEPKEMSEGAVSPNEMAESTEEKPEDLEDNQHAIDSQNDQTSIDFTGCNGDPSVDNSSKALPTDLQNVQPTDQATVGDGSDSPSYTETQPTAE